MCLGFGREQASARGTLIDPSVASVIVISSIAAFSGRNPSERPPKSTVPSTSCRMPRSVLPTAELNSSRRDACGKESLFPHRQTFAIQRIQQRPPCVELQVVLFPLLQPLLAGCRRRILVGQKPLCRSRLQNPENPLNRTDWMPQTAARVLAPFRRRQQGSIVPYCASPKNSNRFLLTQELYQPDHTSETPIARG